MARYDLYNQHAGGNVKTSPEERMMKNERKRVEGLVRQYQRDPDAWTPGMVTKLRQMSDRYDVPFGVEQASSLKKFGVGALGALDAMALDMIPDASYINESTAAAAKAGKLLGTAGSFLIPGAAVAKGAAALGKMGMAGKAAGGVLKYGTGPGMAAQLKGAAAKLAAPAAQRMGVSSPWVKEGMASATKAGQRSTMDALKVSLESKNPADVMKIINEGNFTGARKAKVVQGAAKRLFGDTKSSVAKSWIAEAGGLKGAGGVGEKFVKFMSTSGNNTVKLSKGNITKLAKKMGVDRDALAETLKDYDTVGDFYKAYWKSLASEGGTAAAAGIDYSAILPALGSGAVLGSGLSADYNEE